MKSARIVIIAGFVLWAQTTTADTPAKPVPRVFVSETGNCFFKIVPAERHFDRKKRIFVVEKEAFGVAYRIDESGSFEELWRTTGWYSAEIYLSHDCQHLVRKGPWNMGQNPKNKDLAVAFYFKGKLLKKYSTADLVKNRNKVIKSRSHYQWLARDKYSDAAWSRYRSQAMLWLDWNNMFHLKTCDNILYEFDATSGNIERKKKAKK